MNHKYLFCIFSLFVSFTAVADSSQLPAGEYSLSGYNSDGQKVGGTIKVFVPYSNASLAVGVLCTNKGTVVVKATDETGAETAFRCVINGQPAS